MECRALFLLVACGLLISLPRCSKASPSDSGSSPEQKTAADNSRRAPPPEIPVCEIWGTTINPDQDEFLACESPGPGSGFTIKFLGFDPCQSDPKQQEAGGDQQVYISENGKVSCKVKAHGFYEYEIPISPQNPSGGPVFAHVGTCQHCNLATPPPAIDVSCDDGTPVLANPGTYHLIAHVGDVLTWIPLGPDGSKAGAVLPDGLCSKQSVDPRTCKVADKAPRTSPYPYTVTHSNCGGNSSKPSPTYTVKVQTKLKSK